MIKNKKELYKYLEMDKKALGITKRFPKIFGDEIWKFEIILRKYEFYYNCTNNFFMKKFYSFLHKKYSLRLGIQIPINTFGGGLRINHFGLIVVNPKARIGEWCDIHQGVNIGQNIEADSVPTIGNNVWIGPGVKIFGKIKVGDNVMIGANSVVNSSFPSNIRIAGIPAKKISEKSNIYVRK